MSTIFEEINNLPILEVLTKAGISTKKISWQPHMHNVLKSDGKVDTSFVVHETKNLAKDFWGNGDAGGPFDIIGRYVLDQDTQTNEGRETTANWFISKWLVKQSDTKKEYVPTHTGKYLLENYDGFKLNGYKDEISGFLIGRWVPYDWIQKNHLKVGEVFADIWYYDNYLTTEREVWRDEDGKYQNHEWDGAKNVWVFMFPCYDEHWDLIWLKLRRRDGKLIRGKKSFAIGNTGLLYNDIDIRSAIIVEWEMDYLILKLLWFSSIVGNLWGVQSNRTRLKELLYDTDKIICLYDTDVAGTQAKKALADMFGRVVHEVVFPIREDKKGVVLSDVNDFYNAWYNTKPKWDKILLEIKQIGEEQAKKGKYPFVILREHIKYYYDIEYKKFQEKGAVADYLWVKSTDLVSMRKQWSIQTYENLCYLEGWRPWHYNTLDENSYLKYGWDAEPRVHSHISYLINNICGGKKKNIEWVHKAILFKLTHINNVHVPALVLYGSWWSWKGTFLNLLSRIFWKDNTLVWLGQRDLESSYDTYVWDKLIVEFKEVSSGNKHNDKKTLDRIKWFIGEPYITINPKFQPAREVNNIAWFHLSSNHAVPLQMDSKHSGNRRFTVIKTGNALDYKIAEEMNHETFKDRLVIREYVNWLYKMYPEIPDSTTLSALDNEEKRNLEEACEGGSNQFFEWFEGKYPQITKITNPEKNMLLQVYCEEMWEDIKDLKFKQNNFDLWLSHRYEKKRVKLRWQTIRWYFIRKTKFELEVIPESLDNFFKAGEIEKLCNRNNFFS